MDRTSWKLIIHNLYTAANVGANAVPDILEGDLPLPRSMLRVTDFLHGLLRRGGWDVSNQDTVHIAMMLLPETHSVPHQRSSWTRRNLAEAHLEWLRRRRSWRIWLLWDRHGAHRDEEKQQPARSLKIKLVFVPPFRRNRSSPASGQACFRRS
jgi:hypothetical protein